MNNLVRLVRNWRTVSLMRRAGRWHWTLRENGTTLSCPVRNTLSALLWEVE